MNGENGQALPLAMLALVFGVLVITPFLSHASTSILGSKTYAESIGSQNACDAGIEHAIWSLTNGTLTDQFSGPGDQVTYQLDETINDVTTTVTVTANAIGGLSLGEIVDTEIDTLDFGPNGGEPARILYIAGSVYAIVYTDSNNDGWVKTVSIAGDGTIIDTAIDSLEFNTQNGRWPMISHISGTTYAIAYRGNNGDGYISTLTIESDGEISNSVIDTLEFDTSAGNYPKIITVSGDIYAIAYQGNSADGFIKTVEIASDGDITNSIVDSLEFDTSNGREPDIINITGDIFAVAYRGNNIDGFLKTYEIATDGTITGTPIDTFEFNTYECRFPKIEHISGNIYAIAYNGDSSLHDVWGGGIITTVEIAASGTITNNIVDEGVFDTSNGEYPDTIYLGNNVYAIAYTGQNNDGYLKTTTIENNGTFSDEIIDTLEFDTETGYCPDIIHVNGNIFAIAYTGTNHWHGILKTFEIETGSGGSAVYEILTSAGDTSIRAYVNIDDETVSIVSWQIEL